MSIFKSCLSCQVEDPEVMTFKMFNFDLGLVLNRYCKFVLTISVYVGHVFSKVGLQCLL